MAGLLDLLRGPQAQTPGTGMERFRSLLSPEVALPMAAALLGNQGNAANFGSAFAAAGPALAQRKQKNQTLTVLRANAPELADMVEAGMPVDEAWNLYGKQRMAQMPGNVEYGLNPIWGTDEAGNPVLGTMGKDGSFKKVDTGGFNLSTGVDKVDLGTQWGLINKRTGQLEGYLPKDIAGAAAQGEIGTAAGKAEASAPGDMQAAQNALDLVESIRSDPNRQRGTGFSSIFNGIPGTAGYDFSNKVDQAKSGAFLTAIQQMRGLGSLSNAEGGAATAAVTRMNVATSEEEFMAALDDYEKIVRQGYARAASKLSGGVGGANPAPAGGVDYKTKYGLD